MSEHAHGDGVDPIERDLHATRARLDSRLQELSQRLSPGQVLDEALEYLRSSQGIDFTRHLTENVRERPIPVALAGIGIAWLMAAGPRPRERVVYREGVVRPGPYRSRPDEPPRDNLMTQAWRAGKDVARNIGEPDIDYRGRVTDARAKVLGVTRQAQDTATSFAERVEEALFAARDRVSEGVQDAAGRVGDQAQGLREMGGRLSDAASDGLSQVRDRGGDLLGSIGSNPVLLGSLGVLTGALLGALLPPTEIERDYLGDTVRGVRQAAEQAVQTATDRGKGAAQAAMAAGQEGARKAMDAGREALNRTAEAAADPNRNTAQVAAEASQEATHKAVEAGRESLGRAGEAARDQMRGQEG